MAEAARRSGPDQPPMIAGTPRSTHTAGPTASPGMVSLSHLLCPHKSLSFSVARGPERPYRAAGLTPHPAWWRSQIKNGRNVVM